MTNTVTALEDVDAGAILADKYRIVKVLGQGGMGIVVEAEHVRLGERVAIKFLSSTAVLDREARDRFEREARAAVLLQSEHVARVRDVGELSTGQPYIVMDLLRGQDLAQTIEANPLAPGDVVNLILQTCEALAEAHAAGIVHRDLKPANLFITHSVDGQPHIKLLDFGVASAPTGNTQITQTGIIMGTPAFMCPEQMRSSRHPEPRWDIWSLGVVLYQCLEGAQPFAGDGFAELVLAVVTQAPRPAQQTEPELLAVVERCLHKEPKQRYQNVHEVAVALAPFASSPTQAQTSVARTARFLGLTPPSAPPASSPSRVMAAQPPSKLQLQPTALATSSKNIPAPVLATELLASSSISNVLAQPAIAVSNGLPQPSSADSINVVKAAGVAHDVIDDAKPATAARRAWIVAAIAALVVAGLGWKLLASRDNVSPTTIPSSAVIVPSDAAPAADDDAPSAPSVDAPSAPSVDAPTTTPVDAPSGPMPDARSRTNSGRTKPNDAGTTPGATPAAKPDAPPLTDESQMGART